MWLQLISILIYQCFTHLNLWLSSIVCTVVAPPYEWPITAAVLRSRRPRNCLKSNFFTTFIMFCMSTPSFRFSNPRRSSDLPTSHARCCTYHTQKWSSLNPSHDSHNYTYLSVSEWKIIEISFQIELQPGVLQFSLSSSWLRDTLQQQTSRPIPEY